MGQAVNSTLDLETVLTLHSLARGPALSGTDEGAIYEYDEDSAEEFSTSGVTDHLIEEELINALHAIPATAGDQWFGGERWRSAVNLSRFPDTLAGWKSVLLCAAHA